MLLARASSRAERQTDLDAQREFLRIAEVTARISECTTWSRETESLIAWAEPVIAMLLKPSRAHRIDTYLRSAETGDNLDNLNNIQTLIAKALAPLVELPSNS